MSFCSAKIRLLSLSAIAPRTLFAMSAMLFAHYSPGTVKSIHFKLGKNCL